MLIKGKRSLAVAEHGNRGWSSPALCNPRGGARSTSNTAGEQVPGLNPVKVEQAGVDQVVDQEAGRNASSTG
jgi:hypothetical protein